MASKDIIERIDAAGGRLVFRFWGVVVVIGVAVVGVPVTVGAVAARAWAGAAVSLLFTSLGLWFARYLFSRRRRLSHIE